MAKLLIIPSVLTVISHADMSSKFKKALWVATVVTLFNAPLKSWKVASVYCLNSNDLPITATTLWEAISVEQTLM